MDMTMKQLREQCGYTQKELAYRSGINYRSLQDYEQGHKRLASANGETLLRLSMALGCSIEDLFDDSDDIVTGAPLRPKNNVSVERITAQPLFCSKYNVPGRWEYFNGGICTVFYYDGRIVRLPFDAVFTEERLLWAADAAELQMESAIDDILFQKKFANWEL